MAFTLSTEEAEQHIESGRETLTEWMEDVNGKGLARIKRKGITGMQCDFLSGEKAESFARKKFADDPRLETVLEALEDPKMLMYFYPAKVDGKRFLSMGLTTL